MKVIVNEKEYGFIWGTKCFNKVVEDIQSDMPEAIVNINVILSSLEDPRVLTSTIYHGLNLWCERNGVDAPFDSFDAFIDEYDTIGDEFFYDHIVTDILESSYVGTTVLKYLEKKFEIVVKDFDKASKAKKKYLSALEKSLSTSRASDSAQKKSNIRQLPSTK